MPVLETELNNYPILKEALIWQSGNGDMISYDDWTQSQKSRISDIYDRLRTDDPDLGLNLPSEQNVTSAGFIYFTAEQAFDIYAAHAAHSLNVEFNHLVPWSVISRPLVELAVLFSSASYHSIILPSQTVGYPAGIQAGQDFQGTPENQNMGELNGDPRVGYFFLTGRTSASQQSLIGENELQTLANLTIWLHDNFNHGNIPREDTRYYRWLADRLRPARGNQCALANNGCHSASKLMVDMARSINIPLLHARSQESNTTDGHFFTRTHGGLIYGWGLHFAQPLQPSQPLILWHTDEIYAMGSLEPSFPIDSNGNLLPEPEAKQVYFEQRWKTPSQLARAGFNYNLHKVYPGQGFGVIPGYGDEAPPGGYVPSLQEYEDRADFGMMSGYWNNQGNSNLQDLMRKEDDYAICGDYLLSYYCHNIAESQISDEIRQDEEGLSPDQIPQMHTSGEYFARAQIAAAALGGCAAFDRARDNWNANRGNNLLKQRTASLPVKRKRVTRSKTPSIKPKKPIPRPDPPPRPKNK